MRTITFYSYKGGTGRTLLLANFAVLAARLGRTVVAVDLDLEAPGLAYKFLTPDALITSHGAVRWLKLRVNSGSSPSLVDELLDVPFEEPFVDGGSIRLLPAGRGPSNEYFTSLQDLALDERLSSGAVADSFLALQSAIREEAQPDLLLIDARTGVATSNLATTRVLADDVVALTLSSREQLEGTRAVLRSLSPLTSLRTGLPLSLHVVLTRMLARVADASNYRLTDAEVIELSEVKQALEAPADPLSETLKVERVHALHAEPSFSGDDRLLMRRGDAVDATALHIDYIRLAEALLGGSVTELAAASLAAASTAPEKALVARFAGVRLSDESRLTRVAAQGEEDVDVDLPEQVQVLRAQLHADPSARLPLIDALIRVGESHISLGQSGLAIESLREAVALTSSDEHDEVVTDNALAGFERRFSQSFSKLGLGDEALIHAQSAVRLLRQQRASDDDPELSVRLALALNLQGLRLGDLGRHQEALESDIEGIDMLDEYDGDVRSQLSTACHNASVSLSNLGEVEEALEFSTRSLALTQSLGPQDTVDSQRRLADAFDYHSVCLDLAGRDSDAIVYGRRAVDLLRRLNRTSPRYQAELAKATSNLSIRLARSGQLGEALDLSRESVSRYRQVRENSPGEVPSQLGRALTNLSQLLDESGSSEEALEAALEAVSLLRSSSDRYPLYLPNLSDALALSSSLSAEAQDHDRAVALSQEAVDIERALLGDGRGSVEALARSLYELDLRLSAAERMDEALIAVAESVSLYRHAAADDPEQNVYLAVALHNEAISHATQDNKSEATRLVDEAIGILRRLGRGDEVESALARCLGTRAALAEAAGDRAVATRTRREQERLLSGLLSGPSATDTSADKSDV